MTLHFTKMHGLANDYIYIDCFHEDVSGIDLPELSRRLSRRRYSVGSDGIILIAPSERADCKMEIYNADGSLAMMCGNGIRCVGKYVYDRQIVQKRTLTVETRSGIKTLYLDTGADGRVSEVRVDMGKFSTDKDDIPTLLPKTVNAPLSVDGMEFIVTCVSMGNPHCVIFLDGDAESFPVQTLGAKIENHPMFPERANVEFVKIKNRRELIMRVWERGSGETFACGTGACASATAAYICGYTEGEATVHLRGGDLKIKIEDDDSVFMTGAAELVYDGTIEI